MALNDKLLSFFMKKRRLFIRAALKCFRPKNYKGLSSYWPWINISPAKNFHHDIYSFFDKKITTSFPVSEIVSKEHVFAIVGSGPSVKNIDFCKIKNNVDLILLNGAIDLIYSAKIKPLCCVIIDFTFIENRFELIRKLPDGTKLVTTMGCIRAIYERDKNVINRVKVFITQGVINPNYHEYSYEDIKGHFLQQGFSDNLDVGFIDGGSVMCVAIQLVFHLKAKEIYLLGFDIGNADQPRFNEDVKNRLKSGLLNDYENKILPFMFKVKDYCLMNGIKIHNCSPISKLPSDVVQFKNVDAIYVK